MAANLVSPCSPSSTFNEGMVLLTLFDVDLHCNDIDNISEEDLVALL